MTRLFGEFAPHQLGSQVVHGLLGLGELVLRGLALLHGLIGLLFQRLEGLGLRPGLVGVRASPDQHAAAHHQEDGAEIEHMVADIEHGGL